MTEPPLRLTRPDPEDRDVLPFPAAPWGDAADEADAADAAEAALADADRALRSLRALLNRDAGCDGAPFHFPAPDPDGPSAA